MVEGREKRRETLMCKRKVYWLPLAHPQAGTWPATQACDLTRSQTNDLSFLGLALNPLSHTSRGLLKHF